MDFMVSQVGYRSDEKTVMFVFSVFKTFLSAFVSLLVLLREPDAFDLFVPLLLVVAFSSCLSIPCFLKIGLSRELFCEQTWFNLDEWSTPCNSALY